jgi:DNA-binding MarR family transcriptional regulator
VAAQGDARRAAVVPAADPAVAEALAELVPRLYRLLRTALDDDEQAPSLEQLRVMHRINEGHESVSALAAVRQMRMSAITAVLDVLQARGWISRHPDPTDRRRTRVALTAEGRAALRRGRKLTSRRMAQILDRYSGDPETLAAAVQSLARAVALFDDRTAD